MYIFLYTDLYIYLTDCIFFYIPTCIFNRLFIYRPVYLTDFYIPTCIFNRIFIYRPVYYNRLFIYRPVYLTDFLSFDILINLLKANYNSFSVTKLYLSQGVRIAFDTYYCKYKFIGTVFLFNQDKLITNNVTPFYSFTSSM